MITAYLLTLAALIPVSGWLTSRWGPRRVFLSAIAVFTLASLGCALSDDLTELVVLRVLQGAGGAMMVPVGRLVVLARTAKPDLLRAIAWITWPGLLAPVLAPLAGGLLTTYASWRWIFLLNVPLGALALVAAWRLIPAAASGQRRRLDVLGTVLTPVGLGGLAYTAHLLSTPSTPAASTAAWGVCSLLVLAAAVWHLLRTDVPLLRLRTLAVPSLRTALGSTALFWLPVGAVPFLLPLLFQEVFGWSPVRSGAVVLFVFVGNLAVKPLTTPLLRRWGFRAVLLASSAGVAVTVAAMGALTVSTPLVVIAGLAVASGVVRSVGFTAYNTVTFSDVTPAQLPDANVLAATTQQLGSGFAIAAATLALRLGGPLGRLLPGPRTPASAYSVAFVLLALAALAALVVAAGLHPQVGAQVRGGRSAPPAGPVVARSSARADDRSRARADDRARGR